MVMLIVAILELIDALRVQFKLHKSSAVGTKAEYFDKSDRNTSRPVSEWVFESGLMGL